MKYAIAATAMILAIATAFAIDYESRPDYEEGQYYVWATEAAASNGLHAINVSGWFPLVGYKRGVAVTNAATTRWADVPQQRTDGKWVVPRIPEAHLDTYGVSEAQRKGWWDAFTPDVEKMTTNWFPEIEE